MRDTQSQTKGFPAMRRYQLVMALVVPSLAWATNSTAVNELKSVSVSPAGRGAEVVVEASQAPVYTVFRLNEPDRVVIDVANASTSKMAGHHDGTGPVSGVVLSQFSDAKADVGRVMVGLEPAARYDVRTEGNRIVVKVDREEAAVAPTAPQGEDVVSRSVDTRDVTRPATQLTGVSYKGGALRLVTNGEPARIEYLRLRSPDRLAVDLPGVKLQARARGAGDGLVREVRVGGQPGTARVVVEARGGFGEFLPVRRPDGLLIQLSAAQPVAEVAELEVDGKSLLGTAPARVEVQAVDFADASGTGLVTIKTSGRPSWSVERPEPRSAVLTLSNAQMPKGLEKSLDTQDLGTAVKMVSVFSVPGETSRVRVVVAADADLIERAEVTKQGLVWRLERKGTQPETAVASVQAAGVAAEAEEVSDQVAARRTHWVGKKVSFEFKDIDLHNLLRIIAEISKKNIVVGDDVTGKVTVRLRNVPWDQVLDLVLKSKGLGMEDMGNIIRVAPLAKLEEEARQRAERAKAIKNSTELQVALVPVNYATASEMATRVKEVLSDRGNVSVDSRTNTLIVRDLPQNMARIRSMVASLDTQTPQVLIESRIVEANTRFSREVGVQWGGQALASTATGNPTGLVFPNSVAMTGGVPGGNANGVSAQPNYAVSLPVGAGDGAGGAVGMVFGSAGGALQLNLRLSAMEAQGMVKTVSAPKVTTMDNEQARISQGVSVPFSQTSAAGTNTSFIDARLSLDVTPHITSDGSVLMRIKAENSSPDPANTGANGQPAIQRKEASTNVLVKDGDTTVIGGIYVRIGSTNQAGLPILSKIPVLGFFFRNFRELETKSEMLIFITPRILNRQAVAQNQ